MSKCKFNHNCVTCRYHKFEKGYYVCFEYNVKAEFIGGVTTGEELKMLTQKIKQKKGGVGYEYRI